MALRTSGSPTFSSGKAFGIPVGSCHVPITGEAVVNPGDEEQMPLDFASAKGSCTDSSFQAQVDLRDEQGVVHTSYVTPEKGDAIFNGEIVLQLKTSGLLDIQYKTQ